MKKLHFVNKLSKEKLNKFLNSIGYELNEDLKDQKTNEPISSIENFESFLLCRCKKLKSNDSEEIFDPTIRPILGILASVSKFNYLFDDNDLLVLYDFSCYPFLSLDEEINFNSELQTFLTEEFGNMYSVARKVHLNKLSREIGYKNYEDYLKSNKLPNSEKDDEIEK